MFSEVAKGTQSPNYIRKLVERKYNWKINKNSFMDMLRNRFYIAKVRVPEYKGVPEHYVDGKHDAIIDKVTFEKVQEIIDGKKKGSPKLSKKINPDLFLRKYICCPVCGKSITGATSSGNGGKYTYYNCSDDAKHFRCRAEEANELFAKYLSSLKPNEPILRLYKEVLKDIKQDGKLDIQKQMEGHRDEILKIKERLYNLEDKYLDGDIDKETYHNAKERYNKNISTLEEKIDILENPNRANIEPKGDSYKQARDYIYEEKNTFLTAGHRKNDQGIRGADGRMAYIPNIHELINMILEWISENGTMIDLYTKIRDKNIELGYGKPLFEIK